MTEGSTIFVGIWIIHPKEDLFLDSNEFNQTNTSQTRQTVRYEF